MQIPPLCGVFSFATYGSVESMAKGEVSVFRLGGEPFTGRVSARRLSAVPPRNGLRTSSAASAEASSGESSYAWIYVLFSVCRISDELEYHI